jgi:RNA polymerase sigma-70 factor (ECF subfamily)
VADAHALFATHRDGIFRYLSRIVGVGDAPDLTQEVFLRVSRSAVPSGPAEAQRAWIFRIARNLALNYRRDAARRPALVELGDAAHPAAQEVTAVVRDALAQLAPLDRDVFLLREAAGLSYDEIALACELSSDAVRSRLHRARQALRLALAPRPRGASTISMQVKP